MSDFNFFSFLWVRRKPVFDDALVVQTGEYLTDDSGNQLYADDGVTKLVSDDFSLTVEGNLYRWV